MKRIIMLTILATTLITTSFAETPVGKCKIVENFGTTPVGSAIFYPNHVSVNFGSSASSGNRIIQTTVEHIYDKGTLARIKGYELRDVCYPKACGGDRVSYKLFELDLRVTGQYATNDFHYVETKLGSPFRTFDFQFYQCVFLKSIVRK